MFASFKGLKSSEVGQAGRESVKRACDIFEHTDFTWMLL